MILLWVRAHWRPLGALAALALSFAAGWFAHRPQPAITEKVSTDVAVASTANTASTDSKGPSVTTIDETTEYDAWNDAPPRPADPACPRQLVPVPMPGPIRTVRHTVIEQGPEVIQTQTAERLQEQAHQDLSLTIAPQAAPRWALGAGLEDPLGARRPQVTLGLRLLGPIWLRAAFTPARGAPGATIGAEIQW